MDVGRLGVLVRQLQGALQGRGFEGPYTVDSGALAAGALSGAIVLTHDFGSTDYYVLAEQNDSNFGCDVQWVVTSTTATTATFAFRNLGAVAGARMVLQVFLFAK